MRPDCGLLGAQLDVRTERRAPRLVEHVGRVDEAKGLRLEYMVWRPRPEKVVARDVRRRPFVDKPVCPPVEDKSDVVFRGT